MKKFAALFAGLLVATLINAQSLDDIIKKFSEANKIDKLAQHNTMKVKAKMSMPAMGVDAPMEIWVKKPNKVKTVMSMMGMEIVSAFDGTKGYATDPMSGTVVEMSAEQIKQTQQQNMFKNTLAELHKNGKLTLEGEESVKGSAAYKIKADMDGNTAMMFIDKGSYLLVKTTATVNQQGQTFEAETYPTDYKDFNGIFLPAKMVTSIPSMGMEMTMTYESVEVDVPIDDAVFTLKK